MQTQQPQQKDATTLALGIVTELARKAQSNGILTLEESVEVYYALEALKQRLAAPIAPPVMRAEPGGKQEPEEKV